MIQAKSFGAALTRFCPLYLANIPGLVVGLGLLAALAADMTKAIPGLLPVLVTVILPESYKTVFRGTCIACWFWHFFWSRD